MYERKLQLIDTYINKCDGIIQSQNDAEARQLEYDFIGVFRNEIPSITQSLRAYSMGEEGIRTYVSDISVIKQKLENYKANLIGKAEEKEYDLKIAEANAAHIENTNSQSINIGVTLSQTFDALDQTVTKNTLSADDAEKLKDLLKEVEGAKARKDKNKIWDKVKPVLLFIADKGVDALIAAGPYLVQAVR